MPQPYAGTDATTAPGPHRRLLWIGRADDLELGMTLGDLSRFAEVTCAEDSRAAVAALARSSAPSPHLSVLASDRPGRHSAADALLLSRTWPLMPIVSVASSLVDGRRRSGPSLPGVEEVPWHDLPGRCRWWMAAFDAGLPTILGLPATARREERLLEGLGGIGRRTAVSSVSPLAAWRTAAVAVAAPRADGLEGLCDLLALAGHRVVSRQVGRPRLDETAATLVWDACDLAGRHDIEWLRMLAANRPGLFVVILQSFPRGDAALAARRAGAAAVLGRPVSLEALAGTLLAPLAAAPAVASPG